MRWASRSTAGCIAELAFAIVLWTHEDGGFGPQELVLLGCLIVLFVASLLARGRR
jgi:hypothetical protein